MGPIYFMVGAVVGTAFLFTVVVIWHDRRLDARSRSHGEE